MAASLDDFVQRARRLRLLLFDVDGVLTDGRVTLGADGAETKSFSIRDGAALVWAQRAGLLAGLLSSRASAAAQHRAAELGLRVVALGVDDKRAALDDILRAHALALEEVAFMGDDLMDLPVLRRVGLAAAPADAAADVRERVHWTSQYPGGHGAARELIERVLVARGQWRTVLQKYFE